MTMRIATAEWANPDEVEQLYPYRDGTIWLGRSASEQQVPLGYVDDRHVCLVGGSRGGKGTTGIIPTLLTWPGSICVVDPKGENATITAARRGAGSPHATGMGQKVMVLDPFQSAQVDDSLRGRFNPLDALDPENEETIDEAGRIADALVVVHEGAAADPFWDESARAMVKGLLLHVLTAPRYEGRRNLNTVRKLITRGDWESIDELRQAGETDLPPAHGLLWTGLANNPAFDGLVAGIGDSFTNMLLNSPKQYESVLQVANRNTEFIDSPAMQRLLGASDFQLSDLKTRPEGLSLYLCLPQRYMSTHYRWLRMMIALTVTEMEKVRGRPKAGHSVLLLLDEFAGLKRMEVIEHAVAQIAGYGMKLFFVLQSLEQLKGVYKDNWETFLANAGLKVFFNLEDNFSREYVSKLIGETEVVREVRSASEGVSESESLSRSTSQSRSESRGRSSSTGTSETEGTNTGRSWGVNSSEGRSWNFNWNPGGFLGRVWQGGSTGQSESRGKSRGWTEGKSHSTSRSRTDGTSETQGTSISETEGVTHGTSQSRTSGSSETIHKRALVTPDEIGQLFARIDDRAHHAYPGLALAVISGARPVALRRVNYFEDFQFTGLFDPHPDHAYIGPKTICVTGDKSGLPAGLFDANKSNVRLAGWLRHPGTIVAGGAPVGVFMTGAETRVANLLAARAGRFKALTGGFTEGPLYQIEYFEDGTPAADPFAELRRYCEDLGEARAGLLEKRAALAQAANRATRIGIGVLLAGIFLGAIWGEGGSALGGVLGLVGFAVIAFSKIKRLMECDAALKRSG